MAEDPAVVSELIESHVRVVTWNIWWRFGPWEERLPLIIDTLRAADADIICLQEVWVTHDDSSAARIAADLGHHHVVVAEAEFEPGVRFGNAVLSRWPITSHEHRRLPHGDKFDEQRVVLRADVDGPRGPLQVFTTHLNWRFDQSDVRQEQVNEVARVVEESKPRTYPPIVAGDFNAEPHSVEVELLTGQRTTAVDGLVLVDAWRATHPYDHGYTWDNANPYVASQLEFNRRIDYVFAGWPKQRGAGNPLRCELIGTSPTGDVWPSDHYGLVADLRY